MPKIPGDLQISPFTLPIGNVNIVKPQKLRGSPFLGSTKRDKLTYLTIFPMAEINEFTSGGSSVVADNKLQALQRLVIAANQAEARRNRRFQNNQTNLASFGITSDSVTTFTATVNIPAQLAKNAVTGRPELVVEDTFSDEFFPFTAGNGDLANASSGMEAIVYLAEECTYLEKGIDPNVVVTRADQVILTPDYENSQYVVALNLPIDVSTDAASGVTSFDPFDYLRILQFQAA